MESTTSWTASRTFLGRERELEELRARLREGDRLLTLIGPGGVGKTTLASVLVERLRDEGAFTDGAYFVDLSAIRESALVLAVIRSVAAGPEAGSALSDLEVLCAYLAGRRILLVLDNFEHLLPAASDISELLEALPQLSVIVTSRSPLSLRAEKLYPLAPLPVPEWSEDVRDVASLLSFPSVSLFMGRAQAVRPNLKLTLDNAAKIASLIAKLDGLPLAIELMAVRAAQLGVATVLDRLDRRLPLPSAIQLDSPERHQSLEAAIGWSYELLSPFEQQIARRLSVFHGGWTLDSAEAICSDSSEALDPVVQGLLSLADKSLVQVDEKPWGTWFRYLETVRQFMLKRLEAEEGLGEITQRHASYYVHLAEMAEGSAPEAEPALDIPEADQSKPSGILGTEQRLWIGRIESELDNVRAALRYLHGQRDSERCLALSSNLHYFWWTSGRLAEGRRWIDAALALGGEVNAGLKAAGFMRAAVLAYGQGDNHAAEERAREARRLATLAEDKTCITFSQCFEGLAAWRMGDSSRAVARHREAVALARDLHSPWVLGTALYHQGLSLSESHLSEAELNLREAIEVLRPIGGLHQLLLVLSALTGVLIRRGDDLAAEAVLSESFQLAGSAIDPISIAELLTFALCFAAEHREKQDALPIFQRLLQLIDSIGYKLNPLEEAVSQPLRDKLARLPDPVSEGRARISSFEELLSATTALFDKRQLAETPSLSQNHPLTSREMEVLGLIAQGFSNRQIAEALVISENTVKFHVAGILNKVGASTRAEAIARSASIGVLLDPPRQ